MSVIDTYLSHVQPAYQAELQRVREIIQRAVPDAEESFGYGMPVFRSKGKYLIGFAAFKEHMGLYPGSEALEVLKGKLGDFASSKGTLQFTPEKPMPEALIKDVLVVCVKRIVRPKP
jgi:uncharacterized protein YdhG (YjbR/CyaY superfamily)